MDEVPNEGRKQGLWSIFCATWPVTTQESSSIQSPLSPIALLACVAGQSGARPTVYVRGIIRISYGAGKGRGKRGGMEEEKISRGGVRRRD